jgi:DNA-binding IclR family transcriptional regulator
MPGSVQAVERAAAILRLLSRGRLGIGEISKSLGLARGTTHGLVRTLRLVGFVEQDATTGKYGLGAALRHLDDTYLDFNELRSRAMNRADTLAARGGQAVYIGVRRDGLVLIVHHVFRPDDSAQTLEVGDALPLHATALGKILLAFGPEGPPDGVLTSYTRATLVTPRALGRELTHVREAGWALEVHEAAVGTAAVAAPIHGYGGLVVGALGIRGPAERICGPAGRADSVLVGHVRAAARAVSHDLAAARW